MSSPEQASAIVPDLEMAGFDLNQAFRNAMFGVVSDQQLALDEKVRRMEVIVSQASSPLYAEFVEMRDLVADLEIFCAHNHQLDESSQGSELLSNLRASFTGSDEAAGHTGHGQHGPAAKDTKHEKTKKKKRWPGSLLQILMEHAQPRHTSAYN